MSTKLPIATLISAILIAAPTFAANQDDWSSCRNVTNTAELERNIAACTRIVDQRDQTSADRARAFSNRCLMRELKQNGDLALDDCNIAIRLDPQLPSAYLARGIVRADKNETDGALADFDKAISINPNEPDAYDNRSRILRGRGAIDLAVADLSTSIAINPSSPNPYRERGVIRLSKFDYSGAADDFGRAIDLASTAKISKSNLAYSIIYRFISRSRLGEYADQELRANASLLAQREWPYLVIEMFLGTRSAADLTAAASTTAKLCEANFYVGEWQLMHSNRSDAYRNFTSAVSLCPHAFGEYILAKSEAERLKQVDNP